MTTSKKRCPYCRKYFPTADMTRFGSMMFCCFDHAVQYANKPSTKDKGRKIERKSLAERKKKLKSLNDYAAEAQSAVNAYIRVRDHNKPCISCGCSKVSVFGGYRGAGGWDAGHYRSRGAAANLRFNLLNIHKQCVKCNRDRSGNVVDYRIKLIERIGITAVEAIESDNKPRKFTKEYLQRIKTIFNKRARWYKKRRGL